MEASSLGTDFGIAADEGCTLFTEETQMLGAPAYMSPEQVGGIASNIDTRSDVYALVVVLYELLSSAPPLGVSLLKCGWIDRMFKC